MIVTIEHDADDLAAWAAAAILANGGEARVVMHSDVPETPHDHDDLERGKRIERARILRVLAAELSPSDFERVRKAIL